MDMVEPLVGFFSRNSESFRYQQSLALVLTRSRFDLFCYRTPSTMLNLQMILENDPKRYPGYNLMPRVPEKL